MIFIDGENLTNRFQDMVKAGHQPYKVKSTPANEDKWRVLHNSDTYAWSDGIPRVAVWNLLRVSYYTTFVGDDQGLQAVTQTISEIQYRYYLEQKLWDRAYVVPHVFRKLKKSQKTASVDINISIDVLRHTYNDAIDVAFVVSGDGDYIPLIQEVMRQGKVVYLGALSSGLNSALRSSVDQFVDLDKYFFVEPNA